MLYVRPRRWGTRHRVACCVPRPPVPGPGSGPRSCKGRLQRRARRVFEHWFSTQAAARSADESREPPSQRPEARVDAQSDATGKRRNGSVKYGDWALWFSGRSESAGRILQSSLWRQIDLTPQLSGRAYSAQASCPRASFRSVGTVKSHAARGAAYASSPRGRARGTCRRRRLQRGCHGRPDAGHRRRWQFAYQSQTFAR